MSKIKFTKGFTIEQPIEVLFPLFSAEGEKLWIPSWDYENVMGSTNLHEDYVFLTKGSDNDSTEAIWIVKKFYSKSYSVQFYKVEPQDKVNIITVSCSKVKPDSTKTEVTYEYIGISDKGNEFIKNYDQDQFNLFIEGWKSLLETYFETIE